MERYNHYSQSIPYGGGFGVTQSDIEEAKKDYSHKNRNMENLKFRVHSPEHSEAIQKRLFELGYEWCVCGKTVNHTEAPLLTCYENGSIYKNSSYDGYDARPNKEATLDYLYSLPIKKEVHVRLNDSYVAAYVAGNDFVEVGSQKIPIKAIIELVKQIEEL